MAVYDRAQFARDLLDRLGAPATESNLTALSAWMAAEGGSAAYNPLNTTQPAAGTTDYNSVGVKNYGDLATGLNATVQTLTNGHYAGILAALRQGTDPRAVGQAVAASPWGTGQGLLAALGEAPRAGAPPVPGAVQGQPTGFASDVAGKIGSAVKPFVYRTLFLIAGVAVIGAGLYRTTQQKQGGGAPRTTTAPTRGAATKLAAL